LPGNTATRATRIRLAKTRLPLLRRLDRTVPLRDPIQDGYNWYTYCENDPLNYVDPDGRELLVLAIGLAVIALVGLGVKLYEMSQTADEKREEKLLEEKRDRQIEEYQDRIRRGAKDTKKIAEDAFEDQYIKQPISAVSPYTEVIIEGVDAAEGVIETLDNNRK
jgi:hypothetical protein